MQFWHPRWEDEEFGDGGGKRGNLEPSLEYGVSRCDESDDDTKDILRYSTRNLGLIVVLPRSQIYSACCGVGTYRKSRQRLPRPWWAIKAQGLVRRSRKRQT